MTALALGSLHNVNSCYDYKTFEVKRDEVERTSRTIAGRYDPKLMNLINKMLEIDPINRAQINEVISVTD